jgi:hypothetical protein
MCNDAFTGRRERILMKNIAYVGALAALLDLDMGLIRAMLGEKYGSKAALMASNQKAIDLGYAYAREHFRCPLPIRMERMNATSEHILIDGNTAAALGCVYAGATVGAWYPITPSHVADGGLQGLLQEVPRGSTASGATSSCRPRTSWRRWAWWSAPAGRGRAPSRRRAAGHLAHERAGPGWPITPRSRR